MTSDGFSTPSHFKAPAPPHPTPYSTSSFLTRSKLPSSSVVYGDKKLKAPMHNPYDRFPQNEFDAWIGNLKGSIRRALGQEEEPTPQLHLASSSAETPETHSVSPSAEEQSDWDGVEDSFAEIKARRHISNGKGKERALSVDSEDESDVSGSSDIELLPNEDEGQIAHDDEDEADELEVGREVSVEHWDEEAPEEALQDTVTHGQGDEVLESDEEVYGSEEEEEEEDDGNAPPFAGPVDVVVVDSDSDSDSDRRRSSPVGPSYHYQEEDEEDEEIEEGSEEEGFSDGEAQSPLSSMRQPERSEYVEGDEADDDDESIEVIAVDDDSDIQPEEDEGDEVFPPRATSRIADQVPQLPDPWAGPQMYAEDFYSGGDFLRVPDGATPRSAAHLLGEDGDDVAFLTPGVVTPHEAQSTPIGHGLDLEQDGDDVDTQYVDSDIYYRCADG
ncbi:hypothetical protein ONZ45_g14820 [Pleurotus djamor]|nr:hypothetical protein ONZ45_g14820 [Pleurotus djamor]